METRALNAEDLESVLAFWDGLEGIGLSRSDTFDSLLRYLNRNPGMSYIASSKDTLVGTVLCGHDGRRGYIHHLAVAEAYRGRKVGKSLVELSLRALRSEGIDKCHIFVFEDNAGGQEFWRSLNWKERQDLKLFSHDIDFPS